MLMVQRVTLHIQSMAYFSMRDEYGRQTRIIGLSTSLQMRDFVLLSSKNTPVSITKTPILAFKGTTGTRCEKRDYRSRVLIGLSHYCVSTRVSPAYQNTKGISHL